MKSAVNFTPESFLALMIDEVRPNREVMGRKEQAVPRYVDPDTGVMGVDPETIDVEEYRNPDAPYMGPFIEEQEKYRFLLSPRGPLAQAEYGPEQPGFGPMIPSSRFSSVTEKVIPGYTQRRDALRRKIAGALRGV